MIDATLPSRRPHGHGRAPPVGRRCPGQARGDV